MACRTNSAGSFSIKLRISTPRARAKLMPDVNSAASPGSGEDWSHSVKDLDAARAGLDCAWSANETSKQTAETRQETETVKLLSRSDNSRRRTAKHAPKLWG